MRKKRSNLMYESRLERISLLSGAAAVVIMIIGMILDQMLITLAIVAVTSLFTSFHRMYHVWKMTGGEAGGWQPVQEAFELPVPAAEQVDEDEEGEAEAENETKPS
jgi:hypothetical protein